VPLSGLPALGAEQKWIGKKWNDLSGIVLSLPSDLTLPLIYQDRSGTWQFRGLSLWSTCAGVQECLVAALCGPWRCRGVEEALDIVQLACSDTLSVRLCRLGLASPRHAFWSLLGGEGGQLEGLMRGLRSPQAPRGRGGACLLVSCPVRDPIGGVIGEATPKV
jgi:hypothetical protein